jgi:cobalt transporter subunit CbtB
MQGNAMTSYSSTVALPTAKGRIAEILQAIGAMLFGLLIIGVVGFSHVEAAHNAAHDVRHSNAFPCH